MLSGNVGNMFANPMRDRTGSSEGDVNSPLKDISQKVATMWSSIRTRTLSGHLIESPPGKYKMEFVQRYFNFNWLIKMSFVLIGKSCIN